jgi:hypothetical protein
MNLKIYFWTKSAGNAEALRIVTVLDKCEFEVTSLLRIDGSLRVEAEHIDETCETLDDCAREQERVVKMLEAEGVPYELNSRDYVTEW